MSRVKESDLKRLFKATVDNLVRVMEDGSASPKDKEIALKLINDHQIGIDIEQKHTGALNLPFKELEDAVYGSQ